MAMNNMNYGYPSPSGFSSSFSSPYSSTPTGMRTQRPRFAYAGPSPYPRPRSSASKPNPESFSDSMINNFGSSVSRMENSYSVSRLDNSFPENGNTFSSPYHTQNSSTSYYSCNESFLPTPEQPLLRGNAENVGYMRDQSPQFAPSKYLYDNNASFGINDGGGEYKGQFQKNQLETPQPLLSSNKQKQFPPRRFVKAKRNMTDKTQKQGEWHCELCGLDFTSQIPLEMHLRGAKHAKKLKAKSVLQTIQMQTKEIDTQGKAFHCELCNVTANSSLQLQTHLDGNKHKSKLLQLQQPKDESKPEEGGDVPKSEESQVNGKSNGALIRPLPPEFGEPQPAKITKFSCDICNISVNSDTQLQQHLTSKRHQAKVEGKPFHKGKKNKKKQAEGEQEGSNTETTSLENAKPETEQESSEASKTVMGVKTLTSSFVQGETLQ